MSKLTGLSGIKRTDQKAAKQINNASTDGPKARGSASSKTSADNSSFDRSPYQSIVKSMIEGHLK